MSECTKQTCGECIPLYRYFINQQGVLENDGVLLSVPCPVGYHCDSPTVDITVEEGWKKFRPDLPPIDPDINPECDYECERNQYRPPDDPYIGLNPQRRAYNREQTANCTDIGFPGGSGTVTVPEKTIWKILTPTESLAEVQILLDLQAFELAKAQLTQDIILGSQFCGDTPTPTEIWEYGLSETVAIQSVNAFGGFSGAPVTLIDLGEVEPGEFAIWSDPPGVCAYQTYYVNFDPLTIYQFWYKYVQDVLVPTWDICGGGTLDYNWGANLLDNNFCMDALDLTDAQSPFFGVKKDDSQTVGLRVVQKTDITPTTPLVDVGSVGNLGIRLIRRSRPKFPTQFPLKVKVTNWPTVISSWPLGERWKPSATPEFNGQWVGRLYFEQDLVWSRYACGVSEPVPAQQSLNGKEIQNFATNGVVRWSDAFVPAEWGQPGPTLAGWAITFVLNASFGGAGIALSAYKVGGASPVGDYIIRPDVTTFQLAQYGTACRVATTDPLPANTLAAEVLTASANGVLPAIDGVTLSNGNLLIVKTETAPEKNGIYVVTDIGSAGTPWVLTRDLTLSTAFIPETLQGKIWKVNEGATNAGFWYESNAIVTVDVSPIAFAALPNIVITVEEL